MPTSILGLPVYTVAGINQLAARGALDGRFAAVAGYWAQYALPCPYMPHQPPLSGFCYGGKFGDRPDSVQGVGGIDGGAPLAVAETMGGNLLWQFSGPVGGTAARVVLIVHAADARSWQCDPAQRASCVSRLVIDRVAWANDEEVVIDQPDPATAPAVRLTLDQVIAADAWPGDTVVLAYPIDAGSLNDVDPRFVGQGLGNVWYVRLISGARDADGIAPGRDALVDDATGTVVTTMPLSVDQSYTPARLVLDTNGPVPDQFGQAHFQVTRGGLVLAKGVLDSSSTPFALEPGDYEIRAWGTSGAITNPPQPDSHCDIQLRLAAGDDAAYYADWPGGGDCKWKEGAWPFN